jgi:hypothetical protein
LYGQPAARVEGLPHFRGERLQDEVHTAIVTDAFVRATFRELGLLGPLVDHPPGPT